jgi:thymidylate synthase (FAD)
MSEIRKMKYWGAEGKDNPMYNKKGNLSPNWKGGVSTERQGFYSNKEWKNACTQVWKRDKATCQRCEIKADEGVPLHIHHIESFANKKLRSDINNLILLCKVCHNWVHSRKNLKKEFLSE